MEELYDAAEDDWDDDEDEATQYMIEQSLQEYSKHADSATRYIFMMLTTCVMSGNEDALKVLVQRKEALSNADSRGWIHLHEAAVQHEDHCLMRIPHSASPQGSGQCRTLRGETPLFLAIVHGLRENATFLLQNGCDPDCKNEDDDSALVAGGSYDVVDQKGSLQRTLCMKHEASMLGLDNFVYLLLQSGADPNVVDICEHTPLGLAAQAGHFNVVEILLQKGDFEMFLLVEIRAQRHITPLIIFNNPLMLRGQCVVWSKPQSPGSASVLFVVIKESGMSLLHSAAAGGHSQCLDLLLSSGFDPNLMLHPRVRRNYEYECRSALFFAVSNNDAGAMPDQDTVNCLQVAMRLANYELINTLLRYGANVNYYSRVNTTHFPSALQYALKDEVMLRMLLNNGYDVQRCFDCTDCKSKLIFLQFCEVITVYWLKHISAQVVRIMLDYVYHVTLCSKLKSVLTEQKQWLEICKIQENARSLKHLCRLKIRDCLGRLCLRAPVFISFLPLPASLKDYIRFKEYDIYSRGSLEQLEVE
uniref:Ankyrin repeat and SOCS box containing 14b n=1 Tax=Sinocyclocheilus anshuiensis TaxID=1608454 RepID=A0A671K6X1_9TELE